MTIKIREASLSDIKTLADFQLKLALESEGITLNKNVVIDGLTALLNDRSKGVYYLALDEETPVGCHLITYEWSDWRNGMVWWLQSVYVVETYRNKKVFNTMFSNIQRMIDADPTILGLRLYVDKTNTIAQKVYSRLGMNGDHYTVFELMK
jgi:hypothetical protein